MTTRCFIVFSDGTNLALPEGSAIPRKGEDLYFSFERMLRGAEMESDSREWFASRDHCSFTVDRVEYEYVDYSGSQRFTAWIYVSGGTKKP